MPITAPRYLLVYVILVLTIGLRLFNLAWHSLDGDEGSSLYLATLPTGELSTHFADGALDPHPMLYYVLLKGWVGLAGDSDVALRLPSALSGILMVAVAYRLGRQLFSRRVSALAMAVLAFNPLLIAESQDVRMYAPGALFGLVAVWAFVAVQREAWPRWGFYLGLLGVSLTLACYSHLSGALPLPILGLWALWQLRRGGARSWVSLAMIGLVGVVYLPYLLWVAQRPPAPADMYKIGVWLSYFQQASRWLLTYRAPFENQVMQYVVLGGVAALTAFGAVRQRRNGLGMWLWLGLGTTVLLYVALHNAILQPKTLVMVAAPLALLLGAGGIALAQRSHWLGYLAAAAMIGLPFYGVTYLWRVGYHKNDWRSAAHFLEAQATAQDVVVVHFGWYRFVLGHYYPNALVYPWGSHLDSEDEVMRGLQPYQEAEVIWLTQGWVDTPGGDEAHLVEKWLSAHYPEVTAVYPGGITLKGFAVNYRTPSLPPSAVPTAIHYPNHMTLVGYRLPQTTLPRRDLWLHPPSTWVHVVLYWSVTQPLTEEARVAVTLEDEVGNVWGGDLPRENDWRAFYPVSRWQPGEVIRQDFDVNTNPALEPGEYKLVLRVYPQASDAAWPNDGNETWTILAPVTITP